MGNSTSYLSSLSSSVEFKVALDKAFYNTGDMMSGYVQGEILVDDIDGVPDVCISLVGEATTVVVWTESSSSRNSAGEKTTHVTSRRAYSSIPLLRLDSEVGTMDKGRLRKDVRLPVRPSLDAD